MRVGDSKSSSSVGSARGAGAARGTGARFTLDSPATTARAQQQAPVSILGGLEALIVLNADEQSRERKRRSVRRGHGLLDVLDELKLSLLGGRIPPDIQARLSAALQGGMMTGDPRLDSLMEGIELRAEVELAKLKAAARGG